MSAAVGLFVFQHVGAKAYDGVKIILVHTIIGKIIIILTTIKMLFDIALTPLYRNR